MTSDNTIEWEDGKTYPLVRVEISSASHPFYTGKRQLIADRGGRIDQFRRRYNIKADEEEEPGTAAAEEAVAETQTAAEVLVAEKAAGSEAVAETQPAAEATEQAAEN